MFKPIKLCLIGVIGATLVACVATSKQETTGEYLDSAAVTKKIQAKLIDKLGAQGFAIKVKTFRDEVLLSGVVDNATTQQKAGEIAASTDNVKHVRNDLTLK